MGKTVPIALPRADSVPAAKRVMRANRRVAKAAKAKDASNARRLALARPTGFAIPAGVHGDTTKEAGAGGLVFMTIRCRLAREVAIRARLA